MENKEYMAHSISSLERNKLPVALRRVRNLRVLGYLAVIIAFAASLAGCVKVELNETEHPDGGRIILLTTDWTDRGAGIDIPAGYSMKAGDYSDTLYGTSNTVNNIFTPGEYRINIWNTADNIAVTSSSGMTAEGEVAIAYYGNALLGWFFTGTADQTIEADRDYTVNVAMRQQVRQLTLALEPTGNAKDFVTGITASLSGVVGAIDINTGSPAGSAVSVALAFAKGDDDRYYSVIRLLGITGTDRKLSLTLNYAGGNPSSQTLVCDLSGRLADFNADKRTPLVLNAEALITPTDTGFTADIDEWRENGGTIIAE
jgi:hypothetical protein